MSSKELNIRQFKLTSGEDIVALAHSKDDKIVAIERPMKIIQNLFGGYQLVPWFIFSNQKLFTLDKKHVLHHSEVTNDFKDTYIKVSTEVQTPALRADSDEMLEEMELTSAEIMDEFEDFVQDNVGKKDRILH